MIIYIYILLGFYHQQPCLDLLAKITPSIISMSKNISFSYFNTVAQWQGYAIKNMFHMSHTSSKMSITIPLIFLFLNCWLQWPVQVSLQSSFSITDNFHLIKPVLHIRLVSCLQTHRPDLQPGYSVSAHYCHPQI